MCLALIRLSFCDDHIAVTVRDVETRDFTTQALRHEFHLRAFRPSA